MNNFNRILVGLDFTPLDRDVIEYTEFLAKKFKPTKIYFINVQRNLAAYSKWMQNGSAPMDEELKKDLADRVDQYFKTNSDFEISFEVVEGSPTKQLMHWCDVKSIDLLVLGQRSEHEKRAAVALSQIARNAPCSVCMVPELSQKSMSKIVVPIDFSEYSKNAFTASIDILDKTTEAVLLPFHLYDLPDFGSRVTLTKEKIEPLVKSGAIEDYNNFIQEIDLSQIDIHPQFQVNWNYLGAPYALDFAKKKDADLIVIGSQGKSALKRLFLGSFAEKLLLANTEIPLLLWKNTKAYQTSNGTEEKELSEQER